MTGAAIALLVNLDSRHRDGVYAVGDSILSHMMRRVSLTKRDEALAGRHKSPLDKWRAEGERLLREAFKSIDSHLQAAVPQDDLDTNIAEVRRLMDNMLDGSPILPRAKKKSSFIKWPSKTDNSDSSDRNIMRRALLSLTDLQGARSFGVDCSTYSTNRLMNTNQIAMDTIGRRERGDEDLLPRIDHLIVTSLVRRAEFCLPKYKEQLRMVSAPSEGTMEVMRVYWNKIFEHRLSKAQLGEGKPVDEIFREQPKAALELLKTMPNALEEDEVGIAAEIFQDQPSCSWDVPTQGTDVGVYYFNKFVMKPCDDYISLVGKIIESLNFDLQLRRYLPEALVNATDHDSEVNKNRAYFFMCDRAVVEGDRIKRLLKRGS